MRCPALARVVATLIASRPRASALKISEFRFHGPNGTTGEFVEVYTSAPTARVAACRVPRLRGRTLRAARRALTRARCRLGRVTRRASRCVKNGRVISQAPAARQVRTVGARVRVVVAKRPYRG